MNWYSSEGKRKELLGICKQVGVPVPCKRFGVGKRMGDAVWIHRSATSDLGSTFIRDFTRYEAYNVDWTVARWRDGDDSLALIQSPDFDTADEPTVGTSWLFRLDRPTIVSHPPADPWIWHH